MTAVDSQTELTSLLDTWDRENATAGINPAPILKRISELVEKETDAYFKMDPDPFDDRHPGRTDPKCALGHLLKTLFRHTELMNKLVRDYLLSSRHDEDLHVNAARLLLDILPALETSILSDNDPTTNSAVKNMITWAEHAKEPLRSYSTGLLPGAMELQDMAANFREANARLVPIMLNRLWKLLDELIPGCRDLKASDQHHRSFVGVANDGANKWISTGIRSPGYCGDGHVKGRGSLECSISVNDCSNSSWAEMEPYVIGSAHCLEPLSLEMKMRLIVRYLTPMAEYQELIGHMFENNALQLIFHLVNLDRNKDIRLAFDALRFLSSLLCHKKFAMEFIQEGGVECLLRVVRPSVAATGVSMCLYYLAYFEDAMERVCLLPDHVLSDLVNYALWLLECSHESGRCHATMCFSASFQFRVILHLFDMNDGLRRMFNMMSTLKILSLDDNTITSEDEAFINRQAARHVCVGLKKYLEAHLAIKAEDLRRSQARRNGRAQIPPEVAAYKAAKYTPEIFSEYMELMLACHPLRLTWKPVTDFLKLDGVTLLLQLIAMAAEWHNYTGKVETIRSALDVLAICMISPKTQLQLCEMVSLPDSGRTPGVNILLGVADGEIPGINDPDIQRAALSVLINCVCGPVTRASGGGLARYNTPGRKKSVSQRPDDIIVKMWDAVRTNNGIMVLLKLLHTKTPITEADSIRAMACRALLGLSRDEKVLQIMSKLPMFNNGQLQLLIKEPILQDKRMEHLKFSKYAVELIERVSGASSAPKSHAVETSLDGLRKAYIVAQTRITFHERELLQLVHEHLLVKGLTETACVLQREAALPKREPLNDVTPHPPNVYVSRGLGSPGPVLSLTRSLAQPHGSLGPPPGPPPPGTPGSVNGPIRVNIIRPKQPATPSTPQTHSRIRTRMLRERAEAGGSPQCLSSPSMRTEASITLNNIVTEYLRKQHSLCPNPTSVCPPFSLLQPHQCPVPNHRNTAPTNMTSRVMRRQTEPRFGGHYGARYDRKYFYSRFRPCRSYHDADDDGSFSCCAFSADEQSLILGTYSGELKLYSLSGGDEVLLAEAHNSPISYCQPSRDGHLLLTSSAWGTPQSALWNFSGTTLTEKLTFVDDNHVQFSNISQDKIVGTKSEQASIYDVATGALVRKFYDVTMANNYTRNLAAFSPTDDLLLSDGVLWDVRSGRLIHKFDKFNPNISGVFDPTGLEIIINTEVWDLRSFNLLHTVPTLDQCHIHFNTAGTVIYAANYPQEEMDDLEGNDPGPLCSSFRTYDATTYCNIATIDVKRNVVDLCTDLSDCYLAVIENSKSLESLTQESVCRLYEVGQLRDEEDDQGEEVEENESEDEDAQDSDDEDDFDMSRDGDEGANDVDGIDDEAEDVDVENGGDEEDDDEYETYSDSSMPSDVLIGSDEELTLSSGDSDE